MSSRLVTSEARRYGSSRRSSSDGRSKRSPRRTSSRPSPRGRTVTRRRGSQKATASDAHRAMPDASRIGRPGSLRARNVTQVSKRSNVTSTSPSRAVSPGRRRALSTSPPPSTTLTPSSLAAASLSASPRVRPRLGSSAEPTGVPSRSASRGTAASSSALPPSVVTRSCAAGSEGPGMDEIAVERAGLVDPQQALLDLAARREGRSRSCRAGSDGRRDRTPPRSGRAGRRR